MLFFTVKRQVTYRDEIWVWVAVPGKPELDVELLLDFLDLVSATTDDVLVDAVVDLDFLLDH